MKKYLCDAIGISLQIFQVKRADIVESSTMAEVVYTANSGNPGKTRQLLLEL